ncbi:uncharacterized protein LOC129947426 [Eupeodes corollae]|uniref:uncharacterized protein LOC129947426 n=1 Tax=Eupeodes corollae TaxID=290404 RepID=UPI002492C2B9|nr:uncharacterized protein LOC129947426 [Eupeodes corollae]XP_055913942.1 uncharacterized protein LOC129947426 [Eupeodes corollae]XP_055913943.1 uncharacterized protein LOC129947426 [Eupeodes corollae]
MDEYQYCPKINNNDCLKNQPLLTVISRWFQENHDIEIQINLANLIYSSFLGLIAWFLLKILFRIVKSMVKPAIIIGGLLIIIYTKQVSYNEDAFDFVFNVIANTIAIFSKIFETVLKVVFGVVV